MNTTKSMWKKIREEYGLSMQQFGAKYNYNRQNIWHFEKGDRPMPINLQIEYLKLRNSEQDKIIINYLEERINEKNDRM